MSVLRLELVAAPAGPPNVTHSGGNPGAGATQREISGRVLVATSAMPWNVVGRPSGYPGPVRFAPRSVDLASIGPSPVLRDHDPARPIGRHVAAVNGRGGLGLSMRLAAGVQDADEALALVAEGVQLGVSLGVDATAYDVDRKTGLLTVLAALHRETSVLTFPAYAAARATLPEEGTAT